MAATARRKIVGSWERVETVILAVVLLAVPLWSFSGPWGNPESARAALLVICVAALLVVAGARALTRSTTTSSFSRWGIISVAIFVAVAAISASSGATPWTSWLGRAGVEYDSVAVVAALAMIGLTLQRVARSPYGIRMLGMGGAVVACALSLLGIFAVVGISLPGWLLQPLGTPNAGAWLLIVLALGAQGVALLSPDRRAEYVAWLVTVGALLVSLAIDAQQLWIVWAVGLVMLGLGNAVQETDRGLRPLLPACIALSVTLFFFFLPSPLHNPYPVEVAVSSSATARIAAATWQQGGTQLLFGVGPGNFSAAYLAHLPAGMNATPLWDAVFDRGALLPTVAVTWGMMGALVVGVGLMMLLIVVARRLGKDARVRTFAPAVAAGVIGAVYFGGNIPIMLAFVVGCALLCSGFPQRRAVEPTVLVRGGTVVLAGMALLLSGAMLQRMRGEVAFAAALHVQAVSSAPEAALPDLRRAALLIPGDARPWQTLALQALRAGSAVLDHGGDDALAQTLLAESIAAAQRATAADGQSLAAWQTRTAVYRALGSADPRAAAFAQDAAARAVELAPFNPRVRVDHARTLLDLFDASDRADPARDALLRAAEQEIAVAQTLRPAFLPARYFAGAVAERRGDLASAITRLASVAAGEPDNIGVATELALLRLRNGEETRAISDLRAIVARAPTFLDARWYLSLALEFTGDLPGALREAEVVAGYVPDNTAVAARLDRLRRGVITPAPDPTTLLEEEVIL